MQDKKILVYVSPRTNHTVANRLCSRMPIDIKDFGSVEEVFPHLSDSSFHVDFICVSIEIFYQREDQLDMFDIINTLSTLIKSTVHRTADGRVRKRDTKIFVVVDETTDVGLVKQVMNFPGIASVGWILTREEELWPYDITKFTVKPTEACYADALSRTISSYRSLQSIDEVLHALNDNQPVIIGVTVYDSFNLISKQNPIIKSPGPRELGTGGGHAMTVVGYDLDKKQFLVKNSFGKDWGDNGYAWLPFDYVETEGFEMWVFDITDQPPV